MTLQPLDDGFATLLFETARENGDAAGRYAAVALAFGQGTVSAQGALEAMALIAAGEAQRGFELGLQMAAGYARWWVSVWQPLLPAVELGAAPGFAMPMLAALERP